MGQPGLKTGAPCSNQGLVGRWGRPVLRLGRSEDGAHHIYLSVAVYDWPAEWAIIARRLQLSFHLFLSKLINP